MRRPLPSHLLPPSVQTPRSWRKALARSIAKRIGGGNSEDSYIPLLALGKGGFKKQAQNTIGRQQVESMNYILGSKLIRRVGNNGLTTIWHTLLLKEVNATTAIASVNKVGAYHLIASGL